MSTKPYSLDPGPVVCQNTWPSADEETTDRTALSDEQAEAAENKLSGTPCPACGRIDWLADHRQANGQIACYCDDCGYAVRVSL